MSQDQSLAVIDATDAEVLPPETTGAETLALSGQQKEVLDKCEFHLNRLGRRIQMREVDLVYYYVEAGWWLMRAQAVHRIPTVGTRSEGKFITHEDSGFLRWLDSQETKVARNTAYRWMQGARNAGLTEESNILAIQTLRAERKLHGQTLTALCRKPVDKEDKQAELHEVTPEEEAAEKLESLREAWRLTGEFLTEHGINEKTWADLSREEIEAIAGILHAAHREIKAALKKELPAPATKAA